MPTPFPGMDPYLERRDHWHAVQTRLLVAIADALGRKCGHTIGSTSNCARILLS